MAAVSLSPPPISLSAMSSRRVPLASNPNVVNSPLRGSLAANATTKQKRSFATIQREDAYAQPPPAKKQMLESGIPRALKSPAKERVTKSQLTLQSRRNGSTYESKLARERTGQHHHHESTANSRYTERYTEKDLEEIRQWKSHHLARFPKMVFYFDNIHSDVHAKLVKQVATLGAREEKFFSIDITHVVTTRPIPPEKSTRQREGTSNEHKEEQQRDQEQLQTINPSLLNRMAELPVKRKLFTSVSATTVPSRKPLTQIQDMKPKRNMDVLHRAREMGKKIWTLDKFQRMLSMLLEEDLRVTAAIAYGSRSGSLHASHANSRASEEPNLLQLLHNERVNGPSDRDTTVTTRELHLFKGPYIYVYDYEEKHKPIMVREYNKVQDKADGDWPQFRTAPLGRCPFVEDYDHHREVPKPKHKQHVVKPAIESKPVLQPPKAQPAKPVGGKRTLGETESAHTRGSSVTSAEFVHPPKPSSTKQIESRPNAFTSRAASAKLFGGEPVASGLQPSNVTSAIRSQMISSTAATPGAIGVLSKEVHTLQRKVLQRNTSQDPTSLRTTAGTASIREGALQRSRTVEPSRKLELIEEYTSMNGKDGDAKHRHDAEKHVPAKPKKHDPKPGYCENCQDKFDDFEEHIASKKHRRFADDPHNWTELDSLLSDLERVPRHKSFSTWTPTLPEFTAY